MTMLKYFKNLPKDKLIKQFKAACIAEGITCILLYLVAMPIKYQWGIFWQMIPIGILHGIMFTWYLLLINDVRKALNWDDEDFVFAILAAFFPFASFWVEVDLVKKRME
ncbi:DUF3817 domain-containing protein [Ornithobacterium rhinotracheale]|nr:DUF3817 domain-containing protein [Ornithobacterium rhinotracheale]MRJ08956.1 DUF3817 domain-containing protein [Ornithobacterium rhinotracheale]UOH78966.1 DUF3817 domain-containing protein [Ornithobacterium rhinotracheale]